MAKDKPPEGYSDKLGPLPPENFENDFPPAKKPAKGSDPVYDAIEQRVRDIKKPKA